MTTKLTLEWLSAAGVRAIKTVAQTALGMISVGAAFNEINWTYVVSVALVAGIYSLLTSLTGLPEVGTDGVLLIDTSDPAKDIYRLELTSGIDTLATKSTVKFTVDTSADLTNTGT
jgi:hypothetical protein